MVFYKPNTWNLFKRGEYPVYCDICGRDLTELGGGYYLSEEKRALCPPLEENDCTAMAMKKYGMFAAAFEFKSIRILRRLIRDGLLINGEPLTKEN